MRNGSVCHLALEPGGVDALVVGSAVYHVTIRIRRLDASALEAIALACAGRIDSVHELREGRLQGAVADRLVDRDDGLFPGPGDIVPACDCPERAAMCKHAAAVLSGIGARLDDHPELLFLLRGVDESALIGASGPREAAAGAGIDRHGRNGKPGPAAAATAAPSAAVPPPSTPPAALSPPSTAPAAGEPVPPLSVTDAAGEHGPAAVTDWATPPRVAKKTLTWRPPPPAPSRRRAATAVRAAADGAIRFKPTGELIAGLREQCGCSVAEFADLIQVTPTTVRRWETTSGPLNLHARPWEALLALHVEIEKHSV